MTLEAPLAEDIKNVVKLLSHRVTESTEKKM
jgi:hypothetical protein